MNLHTTNIPSKKPNCIHSDEYWGLIVAWMASCPAHPIDTCINRGCRWTYMLTDHGVWTDVKVVDNTDKSLFEVPQNPDNW